MASWRFLVACFLVAALALIGASCPKDTDPEEACDDGKDNDLDGLWDCDDPDCAGRDGCPEGDDDDISDDDTTADDDTTEDDDSADDDDDVVDDDSADDDVMDDDSATDDDSA